MTNLEKLMEYLHREFNRILFVHDTEHRNKITVTYFGYIAAEIDSDASTIHILHIPEPSTFPIDNIPDDKLNSLYVRLVNAEVRI